MSLSATSPSGKKFFFYAADEVPTIVTIFNPRPGLIIDTIYDDVYLFSTGRTIARRFIAVDVGSSGTITLQVVPVEYGRMEYVEFLTPAGVSWVVGLNDNGTLYTQTFASGSPVKRQVVPTLMHKGNMLWVADNRLGIPGRS